MPFSDLNSTYLADGHLQELIGYNMKWKVVLGYFNQSFIYDR